jgi:hypothetical protein
MPFNVKIHIGPWKTGSTSLQEFCAHNQTSLAKQGILYPRGFDKSAAHHAIPGLLKGREIALKQMYPNFNLTLPEILESYLFEIKSQDLEEMWLSSEDFARFSLADYQRFKDDLGQFGFILSDVIGFTFNPRLRLNSYINQFVGQGEWVKESDWNQILLSIEDVAEQVENLPNQLSELKIRCTLINYDTLIGQNDIYRKFLESMFPGRKNSLRLSDFEFLPNLTNKSLDSESFNRINNFNKFNNAFRDFDFNCPVIFSEDYPNERIRFRQFVDLNLLYVDTQAKFLSMSNTTIWRYSVYYKNLKVKIKNILLIIVSDNIFHKRIIK